MAKSKGFFGLRSGSTKNFTFSELNGQQITKERVNKVKNPRTLQQMRQRMVMATVSAAYSYLKEICDHSFEGFGVGSPCMSEFMRLNLDALKAKAQNDAAVVAFNAYQDKNINPVPFMVSKGSLNEIVPTITDGKLSWSTPKNDADTTTAEGIYAALGLNQGDMVTFILCGGDFVSNAALTFAPQPLAITRLHADKQGAVSSLANAFTVESNNLSNINIYFNLGSNIVFEAACDKLVMGAVIISRKAADKWLRSNATMVVKDGIPVATVSRQLATYPVERDLILNGSGLAKGNSTSSLPKPSLSLSASSVDIKTPNGTANAPKLTGAPSGAAITYSIANSSIATINPTTGVATAKANGSTLVTISVGATETTGATSIAYTLNVTGQSTDAGSGGTGDGE
nr:hypothetical protein [uncultured Prevotella sp.]